MSVILLIIGIILFIGLVVVHEYGHFIAARRGGVDVEEFGIFFPPRLFKKRMKGGWDFTINALPLGGFVKLKGEHDSDTELRSFGAASLATKSKIMVAGVVMNLVTALILFTLLAIVGIPKIIDNQFTVASDTKVTKEVLYIAAIEPGSPADKAGLKARDTILGVGDASCKTSDNSCNKLKTLKQLQQSTKSNESKDYVVKYERDGKTNFTTAKLRAAGEVEASRKTDKPKGYLGVTPQEFTIQRSTWSAPVVALGLSAQITQLTLEGLGKALSGLGSIIAGIVTGNTPARQSGQTAASSQVSGPVGIFFILRSGSELGPQLMLFIIAIISLTLAIMNILPIPALDGGRLWLTLISRGVLKKPISNKREEIINATGFFVLLTLIGLITFVDIKRFF